MIFFRSKYESNFRLSLSSIYVKFIKIMPSILSYSNKNNIKIIYILYFILKIY